MGSKNFAKSISIVIALIFLISFSFPAVQHTLAAAPAPYADLQAKAAVDGEVRVIVGLKTASPIVPDGSLSPAEALAQQAEIDLAQRNLVASLPAARLTVTAQYQYIPYLALKVDQIALQDLINSPLVSSISEDRADTVDMASATALTGANQTWASGYDGTGVTVAILDTGAQWDHPFLGGSGASRLVAEACYSNAGGAGGNVSLCPDGSNAQITGHAADPTTANCLNGLTNLCTHGTHVAGTVAGNGQNGAVAPFSGVAPNASLIAVQVFTRFNTVSASCTTPPCILSYSSDQIKGLEYVYSLRSTYTIASVNMSLGGGSNATACDAAEAARKAAIDNLLNVGIATVISSGNSGSTTSVGAPGCISTAVTIGATNDNDIVTQFSNSNNLVDLLAPGVSIDSSIPSSTYANFNGTSMAAPHVSGAWALLKQIKPSATVTDTLSVFQNNGVLVTDARNAVTKTRIQIDTAAAAMAGSVLWNGSTSTDWATPANWSSGRVPNRLDNVSIPAAPSGARFPLISGTAQAANVSIADGAQLNMSSGTLTVYGSWEVLGAGFFNGTGGTVAFAGSLNQSIAMTSNPSDHFYHLQIGAGSSKQTVSLTSSLKINSDLSIQYPAVLAPGVHSLAIAGSWTDSGAGFTPGTSSVTINGANQVVNTAQKNFLLNETFSSATAPAFPAGWVVTNDGTGNNWVTSTSANNPNYPDTGRHARYAYNAVNPADTWFFSPALNLSAGTTYYLEFNYGNRGAGTYVERLEVKLGGGQTSGSMSTLLFRNNPTDNAAECSNVCNSNWHNSGRTAFTVGVSGAYNLGFHAYSLANKYELGVDSIQVYSLPMTGQPTFYNLSASGTGFATFNASPVIQNNLSVNSGAGLDLGTNSLSVEGTLTNNGMLKQTKDTSTPAALVEFLRIKNAAGTLDKYHGVDITPNSNMGSTSVLIAGNQAGCTANPADSLLNRCFTITPGTAPLGNATVRFWFTEPERNTQAANGIKLWHQDSPGSWSQVGANYTYSESGLTCTTDSGAGCWFQADGITSYSAFALGSSVSAPTSLNLIAFSTGRPGLSAGLALLAGLLLSLAGLVWTGKR